MRAVMTLAAVWVAAGTGSGQAKQDDFEDRCVAALVKDGRPASSAIEPCACIARRTEQRPELREEFLSRINAPLKERDARSSQALRQVRAACVPMPIWGIGDVDQRAIP